MSNLILYGCALLIVGICALIQRRQSNRQFDLVNLPLVEFEDDNSPERYVRDSKTILHKGYIKYIKKGIPFRMRNPADPKKPQVILPFKYLNEIKNAPESIWSFQLFSRQLFLLDDISAPIESDVAAHIVRADLNRNLATLAAQMETLVRETFSESLQKCKDWTPFQPYMLFANTISRVTSMALAGPELSANPEWTTIMVTFSLTLMKTVHDVRAKYPTYLRWLVRWVHPGAKEIYRIRKRSAELLVASYQTRLARMEANEKPFADGVQWVMNQMPNGKTDLLQLADELLFLSVASIHSSSASMLSTVYDLLSKPDSMEEILQELRSVRAKSKSSHWSKQDLESLVKMDSFMKECQRFNPVGMATVQRANPHTYTFADGLKIPAYTQCCFPSNELNHDPDVYPDPEKFDPYRFFNMRQKADPQKYHFAFVSEDSINFGAGTHACPGRHFATNEIKLMLAELLLGYEIKWPKGKSRPPTVFHDFSSSPNPGVDILIRERKC